MKYAMVTLRMYKNDVLSFTFEAMSFEHGLVVCERKYASLGLIGRYYIECSNGRTAVISI